jgi:pyruvate/2-oxoglutarate dehydrogenase complex dihydrolipoamide dehydrogenase (E3) component
LPHTHKTKPKQTQRTTQALGVETDAGGAIKVDDFSATNVKGVWAIGDVTNRINLTPVALMEGMALAKTLFGGEPTKARALARRGAFCFATQTLLFPPPPKTTMHTLLPPPPLS